MIKNWLKNRALNKWLGYGMAWLILCATIWFSNQFVNQLKKDEQLKIENFAAALEINSSNEEKSRSVQNYLFKIITEEHTMPMVLVDEDGVLTESLNISEDVINSPEQFKKILNRMKKSHPPIVVELPFGKQYVYYENSSLLTKLRYYPIILIVIIILFVLFSYWYFKTLNDKEQSYLWAGMAKETAHQIGTPLSSLLGWVELLKLEKTNLEAVKEIEKDISRLEQITERFSKIGSLPELELANVVSLSKSTVDYLRDRISKNVDLQFVSNKEEIMLPINSSLLSWVLENLIKNAVDAMHNKGVINVYITDSPTQVSISIVDTGSGIPSSLHKRIFEPGFTTKKRGWGLGLSLAKRIVEGYHKGKIFVAQSNRESGTEIKILLKKLES